MGAGMLGAILGVLIAVWFFMRYIKRDRNRPPRGHL